MLVSIIKEQMNNYYINLEDKGDRKIISIIKSNNKDTKYIKKDEAINLLKRILSTKLTFLRKEDEYDVYVDEVDNKRYFKNGKENYVLFFINNGINAIEYDNEGEKGTEKKLDSKFYKVVFGVSIVNVSLVLGLLAMYNKGQEVSILFEEKDFKDTDMITESEIIDYINKSNNISDDEKKAIISEDLFSDVLYYSNDKRNYELRAKFSDISIKNYDDKNNTLGYYDPIDISTLHLRDGEYDGVLEHEFIHMLQDNNEYYYIREASAELVSHEYYECKIDSYVDEVKNLKLLIELIGPESIMECNFSGDVTNFENNIKKYLDEKDSKRLLKLFKTPSDEINDEKEKTQELNKEIEELLHKMYYNKTGENIVTNEYLKNYDSINFDKRIYLNQHKENYYKESSYEYNEEYIGNVNFLNSINSDKIVNFEYYRYYPILNEDFKIENLDYNSKVFSSVSIANEQVKWDSSIKAYKMDDKIYYGLDELKDAGLLDDYVIIMEKQTANSLAEIDTSSLEESLKYADVGLKIGINYNDCTRAEFNIQKADYIDKDKINDYIKLGGFYINPSGEYYSYKKVVIPSMADKFPEQTINNKTSRVESNKEELITMLDGDGEELRISYRI